MLYVLAALIVTSFIGIALLKMSGGDKMSNALYSTSASARIAAKSGMMSAIGYMESEDKPTQNQVVLMLKEWIEKPTAADVSHSSRWIRWNSGDPDGFVALSPNQSYKTEIIAFDHNNLNMTLKSYGIGKGGSRATMLSVYNLEGLGYATKTDWGPGHGFYVEDDISLVIRAPITITGNSRFSRNTDFGAFARGSVFDGTFRTQDGQPGDAMEFKGAYTFTGNSYFGTFPYWEQASVAAEPKCVITVQGKSGFPVGDEIADGQVSVASRVDLQDTSYWLGQPIPKKSIYRRFHKFNNGVIKYSGSFDEVEFSDMDHASFEYVSADAEPDEVDEESDLTKGKILNYLGFTENPCRISVDLSVIDPASIINLPAGGYSADKLKGLAGTKPLWNGFSVFSTSKVIRLGIGEVDGNYILIVRNGGEINLGFTGKMFSVVDAEKGAAGGHFTIINEAGQIRNIGGWEKFRGLIYNMANTLHIGGSENVSPPNFYGSVYVEGGTDIQWYPLSADATTPSMGHITYDKTVYEQLEKTGLIIRPGCDDGEVDYTTLKVNGDRIFASLVSQAL